MRYKIDPLTGGLLPAQNDSTVSISSSTGGSGIVESIVAGANVIVDSTDPANPIVSATGGGGTTDHSALSNLDYASAGHTGFQPAGSYLTAETDPVFSVSEAANFVAGDASKLSGIEAGAEVNNISDVNATDLTDGGATTLHKHSYSNLDNLPSLVTTFTGLTDVPDSYTGQSGKVVAVKGTEDGVEFISAGGVGTVTSVAVSGSDGIQVDSGSPITTSGTIALGIDKTTLLTHINVADGADVNVQSDWNQATDTADDYIKNKPSIPTQYTDEMAQDAVGNAVGNGLDYDDTTGAISVDPTEIKLDDFATPDNNTDLDANTTNHGLLLKATAPASGLYNYVGITNGETAYTNKALFDATAPSTQAFGDSAATGSATVAARRDHKHAMPAAEKDTTAVTGILKGNGSAISAATADTDYVSTSNQYLNPTGVINQWAMKTAPTGWLLCDGSAVSRTTYATLFGVLVPSIGTFTVSVASPAVVTLNGHGLVLCDTVYLTTTGALPTGLSANTIYYVIYINANTFGLATTYANAVAGTGINTSGTQSGTHTLYYCPWGLGDGSSTFNVPNFKGKVGVGLDSSFSYFRALGSASNVGENTHTLTAGESGLPAHSHTVISGARTNTWAAPNLCNSYQYQSEATTNTATTNNNSTASASSAHNNLQPYNVINYIIKT